MFNRVLVRVSVSVFYNDNVQLPNLLTDYQEASHFHTFSNWLQTLCWLLNAASEVRSE